MPWGTRRRRTPGGSCGGLRSEQAKPVDKQYADICEIVLAIILGVATYSLSGGMSPPQNRETT